jgi:GNAT superfamily N-acetyltransferase
MTLSVRQIDELYNQQMLRILLDSPMESDGLTLCLDRSPDMLAVPKLFFDSFKCFGFFMDERLVGYAMICRKEVYVHGKPREIGYLANMYVLPEARKRGWLYKASEPLFKEALQEVGLGYAVTLVGNKKTETMIGRRIQKFPFIPFSKIIGINIVHNILITFDKRNRSSWTVSPATLSDIPQIARLLDEEFRGRLFGPVMTERNLLKTIANRPGFSVSDYYVAKKDGRIVGVCSAWDVSAIRNVRVMAYHKQLRLIKVLHGIVAPVMGFPALPEPGEPFREIVINDYGIENRDPRILKALISHIYHEKRKMGYNMVQIGSYEGDPILTATKGFFTQPLRSLIVFGAGDPELIDREGIDCSRAYLDIALT